MKISVGIPIYDGKVPMHLVLGLLTETSIARELGDTLTVRFLPSCTNLALGRNQIVKDFLASEDEKLVFVDADVTFEPGAIVKLANYPGDFVGGAYRLKQAKEDYPVLFHDENPRLDAGLVEVAGVPTGLLSLSRKVFDTFRAKYPGREYSVQGQPCFAYFQIPFRDRCLWTEDAYFCREWRESGGKIYLDPELNTVHWDGNIPYPGRISTWIRQIMKGNDDERKAQARAQDPGPAKARAAQTARKPKKRVSAAVRAP